MRRGTRCRSPTTPPCDCRSPGAGIQEHKDRRKSATAARTPASARPQGRGIWGEEPWEEVGDEEGDVPPDAAVELSRQRAGAEDAARFR